MTRNRSLTNQTQQARPADRPGPVPVIVLAMCGLIGLAVLGYVEPAELRGEFAFARFLSLRQLAEKCDDQAFLSVLLGDALSEVDLVTTFSRKNPDALQETSATCLKWLANNTLDAALRLRCAQAALHAAALGIRAAPSDYELWLCLGRAQLAMGLGANADRCLQRAQSLAPPGMKLDLLRS